VKQRLAGSLFALLASLACLASAKPALAIPAVVRINEFNANITGGCDLIELRVVRGGTMGGFQIWQRTSWLLTFGPLTVDTDDLILLHFNASSSFCNTNGSGNEFSGTAQFPSAQYPMNRDKAWDWFSSATTMISTDNVITLFDDVGAIVDAVLTSNSPVGPAASASETQASNVAAVGQWQRVGGGVPPGGFVDEEFREHSVQGLASTSTSRDGTSLQRIGNNDTNTMADWNPPEAQTWGLLNGGQTAVVEVSRAHQDGGELALFARPSVMRERTRIGFGRPLRSTASLAIVDVNGRRVRTWSAPAGIVNVVWDGLDQNGIAAPAGLYLIRLIEGRSSAVARVVRVK
jgi:hypothetical protein